MFTKEQLQTIYTALRIERERNREIVAGFPTEENKAILAQIEDALQAAYNAIQAFQAVSDALHA